MLSTRIVPPFTAESAAAKVQMAADAWNSKDPERVAPGLLVRTARTYPGLLRRRSGGNGNPVVDGRQARMKGGLAALTRLAKRLVASDTPRTLSTLFCARGSTYRALGSMVVSLAARSTLRGCTSDGSSWRRNERARDWRTAGTAAPSVWSERSRHRC